MIAPTLMLIAWGFELLFGWPDALFRRIGHPVTWIGKVINLSRSRLNKASWPDAVRYALGAVSSLTIIALVGAVAVVISLLCPNTWWGWLIEGLIASSLIASRSLYVHVSAVAKPLAAGDTAESRHAVSQIVGRDPSELDDPAIARASLESLAENMSDGVVAPLFWGAIFGLPGLAIYKTINTLDSMIGHRTDEFSSFGGFAARLDDVANLIPARLSGVLLAAASLGSRAFEVMMRDARHQRSPNAGWPEAAMAGALGVRLSGPRVYGGQTTPQPWLNGRGKDPDATDVLAGLTLYVKALGLGALMLGLVALGAYIAS